VKSTPLILEWHLERASSDYAHTHTHTQHQNKCPKNIRADFQHLGVCSRWAWWESGEIWGKDH